MNNRKTRTEKLIQLTVLVFLVIRLKYFFTEPRKCSGRVFLFLVIS